jgi:hypothetical protein
MEDSNNGNVGGGEDVVLQAPKKGGKRAKTRDDIDLTVGSDGSDNDTDYDSAEDSEGSLRDFIVSGDEYSDDDEAGEGGDSGQDEDGELSTDEGEEDEFTEEGDSDDDEMASVTSSMCELDSDGEIVDVEYVPRVGPRSRSNGVTKRVTRSHQA